MYMVEVFKTNVEEQHHASMLIAQIHKTFTDYIANFDLEDCDRILRIKSSKGSVQCFPLIDLLHDFGFTAEVLSDDIAVLPIRHIITMH